MRFLKSINSFVFMTICMQTAYGQAVRHFTPIVRGLSNITEFIKTDSGLVINNYYVNACKTYSVERDLIPLYVIAQPVAVKKIYQEPVKKKLLIIHGNVSYDFFYRSQIDTPFYQQNLQQHTEKVWLDVLVKEQYPFKVGFTARQSNSPFYRDLYNMNLNFDKYGYTKNIKQNLLARLAEVKWKNPYLAMIDSALKEQLRRYQLLKNYVNGPEALQKEIEAKEKIFYSQQKKEAGLPEDMAAEIPGADKLKFQKMPFAGMAGAVFTKEKDLYASKADSAVKEKKEAYLSKADSLVKEKKEKYLAKADSLIGQKKEKYASKIDSSSLVKDIKARKKQIDSLEKSIARLRKQSDSIRNGINQNISKVKQAIYKASNTRELEKIAMNNGIADSSKGKLQKFLSNIKTLNIGRSLVDYTELTAQNVMLTGINIEYNPSYYVAVAAGKIDYGFRDIFGRGIKQKNQYLLLGRIGWGDKDKRTVILTVFDGRKNNYSGLLAADSGRSTAKLFGYSIETIFRKNENTFLSLEIAKSTKTKGSGSPATIEKSDNLFKYSDDSNMGFNIKGQTVIPETDTRISGFFRKTGAQFQSFSLFTYNTNQQAWQLRADQSFLKRKINVTAMLRQNDFTSPLTDKTFKTSTVFKSIQLNVRFPHWPVLNAGYYPGTQFYVVDHNTIRENAYYILNGSILYAYRFKGLAMNSSFIYNRYFNQATDSGFVLYKGINYILSQAVQFDKLQVEGSYSYNKQTDLDYYTLDANGDYSLNKILKIGAGVKYNHVLSGKDYWGSSLMAGLDLKKLGSLQVRYEKSYLPTIQQTLYPVETGRVSWYKTF